MSRHCIHVRPCWAGGQSGTLVGALAWPEDYEFEWWKLTSTRQWDILLHEHSARWLAFGGVRLTLQRDHAGTGLVQLGIEMGSAAGHYEGEFNNADRDVEGFTWWSEEAPLFSVLAMQLADAATAPIGRCSWCGNPYGLGPNARAPQLNRRNFYSDDCRYEARRVDTRERVRKVRARRREGGNDVEKG